MHITRPAFEQQESWSSLQRTSSCHVFCLFLPGDGLYAIETRCVSVQKNLIGSCMQFEKPRLDRGKRPIPIHIKMRRNFLSMYKRIQAKPHVKPQHLTHNYTLRHCSRSAHAMYVSFSDSTEPLMMVIYQMMVPML